MKTLLIIVSLLLAALSIEYTRKSVYVSNYISAQVIEADKLKSKALELEKVNRLLTKQHSAELLILRNDYESAISFAGNEYNGRLLQAEKRANYYRSLSETGRAGCNELEKRTTRYDKLIEEGRQLVIELRTTLELRTDQLSVVVKQLEVDRQLLRGGK